MRIAGVDPGTIQTGVCILEDSGKQPALIFSHTIRTGRGEVMAARLETIYNKLKSVFAEWKPNVVALEGVFYQKDFTAAVKIGEARAIVMLAARVNGISIVEYSPARVKQAIGGNGRASKDQIQYMVRHILNFRDPLSADSSDAAAIALCHLHSQKFDRTRREVTHV